LQSGREPEVFSLESVSLEIRQSVVVVVAEQLVWRAGEESRQRVVVTEQ
jgi:hypothetical protein